MLFQMKFVQLSLSCIYIVYHYATFNFVYRRKFCDKITKIMSYRQRKILKITHILLRFSFKIVGIQVLTVKKVTPDFDN